MRCSNSLKSICTLGAIALSSTSWSATIERTENLVFDDLDSIQRVDIECPAGTTLKSSFARAQNRNVLIQGIETRDTNQGRKSIIRLKRVANQNDLSRLINNNPIAPISVDTVIGAVCEEGISVMAYGAIGDGLTDDTQAIRRAINAAPAGSTVYFPRGNYRISGQLAITKRLTIQGDGFSSQIFQQATDKHLFTVNQVRAVRIADLFLGSAGVSSNASLIRLDRAHYSRVERVAMGGGVNGIRDLGSIGVIYEDLKTVQGIAQPGYFAINELSDNQVWYLSRPNEQAGYIASNATTLINPILRAGNKGISIVERAAQGNHLIIGGIIEANRDIGMLVKGNGQPISILGTHFEGNATDIKIDAGNTVSFHGILSTGQIDIDGNSTDISFQNAVLNRIDIADTAVRTSMINTITDLDGGPSPHLVNNADDTLFLYTGTARSRLSKARSTLGIGTSSPPNNQADPFATINVRGKVFATEGFMPSPSCPTEPNQCPVDPEPPTAPEGHYYLETNNIFPESGPVYAFAERIEVSPGQFEYEFKYEDDIDVMSATLEVGDQFSLGSDCCDTIFDGTLVSVDDTQMIIEGIRYLSGFGLPRPVALTIPRGTTSRIFECAAPLMCFAP